MGWRKITKEGGQASEMSLHVSNAGWTPGLGFALQSAILGTIQDTWAFSHASVVVGVRVRPYVDPGGLSIW
jgi:hypothetical protein